MRFVLYCSFYRFFPSLQMKMIMPLGKDKKKNMSFSFIFH